MAIKINGDNSTSAVGLSGGDDDSGVRPGTNQVEIVTGGTARVTVNNSLTTIDQLTVTDTITASGSAIICGANPNGAVNVGGRMRNIGQLQLTSNGGTLFQGMDQGNATPTVVIDADGSGTFAGDVQVNADVRVGTTTINTSTNGNLAIFKDAAETNPALTILNRDARSTGGTVNEIEFWRQDYFGLQGAITTNGTNGQGIGLVGVDGIQFGTGAVTAPVTSNTLDDYEEGTWTPTVYSNNLSVGFANYVKTGTTCTVNFKLDGVTSWNAAGSNPLYVFSFPFACKGSGGHLAFTGAAYLQNIATSYTNNLAAVMEAGSNRCRFAVNGTNANFHALDLNAAGTGSWSITCSITYITA